MTEVKLIRIQTIQIPDWLRLYELLNLVFPQGGDWWPGSGQTQLAAASLAFVLISRLIIKGTSQPSPAQCNALLYWTELVMEIRKWRICINMCSALRDGRSGAIFFINN